MNSRAGADPASGAQAACRLLPLPSAACHRYQRENDSVCQQAVCNSHWRPHHAGRVFPAEHPSVFWDLSGLFCGDIRGVSAECAAGRAGSLTELFVDIIFSKKFKKSIDILPSSIYNPVFDTCELKKSDNPYKYWGYRIIPCI